MFQDMYMYIKGVGKDQFQAPIIGTQAQFSEDYYTSLSNLSITFCQLLTLPPMSLHLRSII